MSAQPSRSLDGLRDDLDRLRADLARTEYIDDFSRMVGEQNRIQQHIRHLEKLIAEREAEG